MLQIDETLSPGEFLERTRVLIGMPVSHAWRGFGSAIFLELGRLSQDAGKTRRKGEATIMIEWSWRFEKPQSVWFGSFSTVYRMEKQLTKVIGMSVQEVAVEGRLPELVLTLEGGVWLHSFMTVEGQPEWTVFLPDGSWLGSVRGRLRRQSSTLLQSPD